MGIILMMETGIITTQGKFIPCDSWKHVSTAIKHNTDINFLVCRNGEIDIVGNLNNLQYEALIDYCTRNKIKLEDAAGIDLEEALNELL